MTRPALLRYRAERLLRRDFAGLRSRVVVIVRSRLSAIGVRLDPADLDACYAQAWHGLYAKLAAGERIEDPSAWLVLVTYRRAIDESRVRGREQAAFEAQGVLALGSDRPGIPDADVVAKLDDRVRLHQVLEALNGRLSPRERQAACLCYLQGLSRSQAARSMGISVGRMRKLMDGSPGKPGVAAKMTALLQTVGAGGWCAQQGSLMRAYAFGILDPRGERHRLALGHLRECPACRALVRSLRGLAVILPPPPISVSSSAGWRAGRRSLSPHTSALPVKLAAAGAVALSVGGGYALVAGGASGPVGALGGSPGARTPSAPGSLRAGGASPAASPAARTLSAPGHGRRGGSSPATRAPSARGHRWATPVGGARPRAAAWQARGAVLRPGSRSPAYASHTGATRPTPSAGLPAVSARQPGASNSPTAPSLGEFIPERSPRVP
jgi:DNA-directed RNA polymerase specialized sigma24 family protein